MNNRATTPVGQVRPSQLLWTYGPGALVDLPNLSVLTMGIDRWRHELCPEIMEARLLAAVQERLGGQVQQLRSPPMVRNESVDPFSAEGHQGVPVRAFPRWLRCVRCGLLGEVASGLFKLDEDPYRPERSHFVHLNCEKAQGHQRNSDAVPARFMVACRNGHLDDFPWHWFVHGGSSDCTGVLRFFESGASLQTENLWVRCDTCDKARSLAHAFGKAGKENLPACRGRHPHLDRFEACDQQARAVLLGATNSWFPVTMSALAIPVNRGRLDNYLDNGWQDFKEVESAAELKGLVRGIVKAASLPGIEKFSVEEIWEAIQQRKTGEGDGAPQVGGDIKRPEWEILIDPSAPADWPHYKNTPVGIPQGYETWIAGVSLLERLREVNALIGFTRVEAPDEAEADDENAPDIAALCNGDPEWVPASEVHGEGIFIRFHESALNVWESRSAVTERTKRLFDGHKGWRNQRGLDPEKGWPGIRYCLLHTISHLLIRELALTCGYSASSIRERIYASTDDSPMAGILLYTAAADSDGTLGGLVELGKPENLRPILDEALERAQICASDPLCSEHDPSRDQSIHAASCHACSFVAETSCERGNRYLDRALVIPTFADNTSAFFPAEAAIDG